MLLPISDQ